VFKNRKGFALGVNLVLLPASVSTLGEHSPEGLDVVIDKETEGKLFTRCVVNNAAYDYFSRCTAEGSAVTAPPANLRIWVFQHLDDSLAPMLQQGVLLDSGLVSEYIGEYKDILKMFLPDIILGTGGKQDYASIFAETTHCLAHSSHFVKAGKAYWNCYMTHVLKSFVTNLGLKYGTGLETDSGYCEVSEMWSYFLENIICKERYGAQWTVTGLTEWFSPQILLYMEERGLGENKIFPVLGSDVISIAKFKTVLCNTYPEHLSLINQAFERYSK